MANLVQSDYDALQLQLVNKKRTAGANSGKTIQETQVTRGIGGPGLLVVHLLYTDGAHEFLTFNENVEAYPPGAADTSAHLHQS